MLRINEFELQKAMRLIKITPENAFVSAGVRLISR